MAIILEDATFGIIWGDTSSILMLRSSPQMEANKEAARGGSTGPLLKVLPLVMLVGPGGIKAIPANVEVLAARSAVSFSPHQLEKKFKHAADFVVESTKKNPTTLARFEKALTDHLSDAATIQKGTYGFVKDSSVFFNSNTNNILVLDSAGNFVTGFRLSPNTPQFNNFMNNGILR